MRHLLIMSAAGVALAACQMAETPAMDAGLPDVSDPMEQAMQLAFPGVDVPPYVPCMLKNLDTAQVSQLAAAGLSGDYTEAAATATQVAANPETAKCIASASLPSLPV